MTFDEWFRRAYPLYDREGRDTSQKEAMREAWAFAKDMQREEDAERCDRAYVNGTRFGWNCGVTGDRKKFDEGVANYESLIRDECKEQGHG